MSKYVSEDNKVGVLVSPGYGGGWSTWDREEREENICFDWSVVKWVLEGMPDAKRFKLDTAERLDVYVGGMDNLEIKWVDIGTKFRIEQYDGHEYIQFEDDYKWETATIT
jgi:hypothetical protein